MHTPDTHRLLSAPRPPRGTSLPAVPQGLDQHVAADLDVGLRTHRTLVVQAWLEPVPGQPGQPDEPAVDLALVVPRSQCRGDRPRMDALCEAAREALARLGRGKHLRATALARRRVLTRVDGDTHWLPLGDPQ